MRSVVLIVLFVSGFLGAAQNMPPRDSEAEKKHLANLIQILSREEGSVQTCLRVNMLMSEIKALLKLYPIEGTRK